MKSRLADFIELHAETIIGRAITFAESVDVKPALDKTELRDHLPEIISAIVTDLRQRQTRSEAIAKSVGEAPEAPGEERSAAGTHALHRARSGYSISNLFSEYRALRASVLNLWSELSGKSDIPAIDVTRFNEAVDEAVAESVRYYAEEEQRWRNIFLGVLGHDLRNPLNALLLTSEFIAERAVDAQIVAAAQRAIRSGEHMRQLLEKLLAYNQAQLGGTFEVERVEVDLAAACAHEVDLLRDSMPEAAITFEGPATLRAECDASCIREVVANLVTNAYKYGERGGEIHVTLREDGMAAEITVSNAGKTIPPEVLDGIFDPLTRNGEAPDDHERVSMGLGLFVVKQVAQAHGGTIDVASSDGTTAFTLRLPKEAEKVAES